MKRSHTLHLVTTYIILIAYFTFLLLPILWVTYSSFKDASVINSSMIWPGFKHLTVMNYIRTISLADFPRVILNTLIIALGTTVLTVTIATLAAYSASRIQFLSKASLLTVVSSQMYPYVLVMIPFYMIMMRLGLVDKYIGIILTHTVIALPFSLWMLKGYFDRVPKNLDEAAYIDGCGHIKVLTRIILPISAPGLAVVAFFAFMVSWGDYLFVSILSQSKATTTLTILLQTFMVGRRIQWEILSTATVICIVPTIILFSIAQKWLVEGLMAGAVKE
ncbi:MAG TPA: carbohydrate ABC transporter permease [Firmicutes bacterium]|nr:carbohydrate ABC transporter permease [Bacillota bacterium]